MDSQKTIIITPYCLLETLSGRGLRLVRNLCENPYMTQLFILPVLLIILLLGTPASAADFRKGLDAYIKNDYATALREWRPLAEQGDAQAQNNLGWMYRNGQGVTQDDKTAVKWYRLAAEQGFAVA